MIPDTRVGRVAEILAVFLPAGAALFVAWPFVGDRPMAWQAVVWVVNVLMIVVVWLALRLRGQGWAHFGLRWQWPGARAALRVFLRSLVALAAGLGAFVLGAVVGGLALGVPEGADISGYDYFAGNLPLFLLVLAGVWIASSFGEEVVYRAFLINRLAESWGGTKRAVRGAVLVAGLAFGLAHFTWGAVGIVETTFMGIALGIAYVRFGRNLWVTILAHAIMDTVLMTQVFLGGAG